MERTVAAYLDDADDEWQKRLMACMKKKGRNFRHFAVISELKFA